MPGEKGRTDQSPGHLPAPAPIGLMTLGKLLYSLVSVASSYKMAVIACTPGLS